MARDRPDLRGLVALGAAVAAVAIGYATRARWLAVELRSARVDDVVAWQRDLAALEGEARGARGLGGASRPGPGGVTIALAIDPADGGRELHAFTWTRDPALAEAEGFALAGLALQRLPAHHVLRAGAGDGGFQVWALVEPGAPSTTSVDDPRLVLLRAHAASAAARRAAVRAPPPVTAVDATLLPPKTDHGARRRVPW